MAGNVWEWTLDEYEHTFYVRSPEHNPLNLKEDEEEDGSDRTLRGGGWFSPSRDLRATVRSSLLLLELRYVESDMEDRLLPARIGFRCARAAEAQ